MLPNLSWNDESASLGFPDPSGFTGSWEERLEKTIEVRNMIEAKVKDWCREICQEETTVK